MVIQFILVILYKFYTFLHVLKTKHYKIYDSIVIHAIFFFIIFWVICVTYYSQQLKKLKYTFVTPASEHISGKYKIISVYLVYVIL